MSRANPIDDGGPAFARPASIDTRSGTLPDGDRVVDEQDGLTLRDYFAARLAPEIWRNLPHSTDYTLDAEVARRSYALADALVAARKGGGR